MKKYLSIIGATLKNCIMNQFEYRFETITWAIMSVVWMLLAIVSVNLIFGKVNSIAGWNRNDAILVVYVQALFAGLMAGFVIPGIIRMTEQVSEGGFDYILAKPVNSRFLASICYFEFDQLVRIALSIGLICQIIIGNNQMIARLPESAIFFFGGIVIFYNVYFILGTTVIWFTRLNNLEDLLENIYNLGRYPTDIFTGSLKVVLTYIVPVAFIATFPVRALLGKTGPVDVLVLVVLVIGSFIFSQWFWNFSLKRYSSASS